MARNTILLKYCIDYYVVGRSMEKVVEEKTARVFEDRPGPKSGLPAARAALRATLGGLFRRGRWAGMDQRIARMG